MGPGRLILAAVAGLALAACDTDTTTESASMPEKFDPFADDRATPAPNAEKRPVEITQHGETRVDNYGWMRDDNWQEVLRDPSLLREDVRAHLEVENAYYETVMASESGLRETLFAEMRGRIKEDDSSVPSPDGPYAYSVKYREGGQYPVFVRTPRDGGEETVLFDGDAEGEGETFFSIGAVNHSPDHALIAYGVDKVGSEYYTIRVRDAETGEEHADVIESTDGDPVWAADSRSFFYIKRDDNQRPKWIMHHELGADASADRVVYEEEDDGFFLGLDKSQSGAYIFISSANQVTSETRVLPADAPDAAPVLIAPRSEGELYEVSHHGEHFYILTNADGAVDFKIVRAPVIAPGRENWEDWLAHEPGTYITSVTTYQDYIVRLERHDALPRIIVSNYDGDAHAITFEEAAYSLGMQSGYEFDTATLRFSYDSPSTPAQTYDYDLATRARTLLKTQEIPSGHNPDLYVVERITAEAADGAQVPVTILRLKSTPVDGSAPVLLYGYGSYGITIPAAFSTTVLSMVDRGAIYAVGHIRGGAARGRQWYLDGKLDQKMNTFTDFNTVAETLIAQGYTSKGRIVIYGGSAGGLLVGASVNLRPDLYGGVIGAVPFVDVINTISDAELPLTPPEWPEWGDPITTREGYDWIMAYSPYDNIQATNYPPVLATGGLTDYRVTYWEPAKWIARLRDDAEGGPFLLRMNMGAGHGGSAARFERLDERAHLYAFALKIFELESAEPVSHGAE